MSPVVLPEWVAEAEKGSPRVPVGQVVASCRWPIAPLNEHIEIVQDRATLASIAAQAFPIQCLACRSDYQINVLIDYPDPGLRALEGVACPNCGTVGLWPPNRPVQELKWANPELWETYGAGLPLPEGAAVRVPRLCGREVKQNKDVGAQPTYCGCPSEGERQAHTSKKAGDARNALVKNASEAARPKLAVVRDLGAGEDRPVEAPAGRVESSAEVSGADALEAMRTELEAARRLLDDSAARVNRAAAGFEGLAAAVARERAELEQRCVRAEDEAGNARRELEQVREEAAQAVAAAEEARSRAEGRAEVLAADLERIKRGELEQLVVSALDRIGSRRGAAAGERLSTRQRDMILSIGGGRARVVRAIAEESWYVDGAPVGAGVLKTLDSLQKRGMIEWAEGNADFAVVQLAGVGADFYRSVTRRDPEVVTGLDEQMDAEDVMGGADAVVEAAEPVGEGPEGWVPADSSVQDQLLRVRAGGVTRGADRQWMYTGGISPTRPAVRCLDWMLSRDVIGIGDGGRVYVVGEGEVL